ncbi:MAG: CoA pyrophosphatase [Dehalococcoidia bacterium]|nr:CoA pyrophosphatase [Dehalococcoidia bacterium]MDP7089912.1 CoA pyrophosphatase [Dehalococcoidia bacterium]MDP7261585.1 CoA pyrophosphatase [Dehalococcoidia bacterium]MDP7485592.1 CoA pyrophosphatase [Dehalococcoidia bacterium]
MNTSKLTINRLETTLRSYSGMNHEALGTSPPAAVSVLFNMIKDEPCVLMIKRAETLRHHSGQWAFPGGMIEESDDSAMHAALRETNEELGIESSDIDIWCQMPPIDTSTGFEVWPYAGRVTDGIELTLAEAEVTEIVNVPVRIFVDEMYRRSITVVRSEGTRRLTGYAYEDRIIWGASATIISNTIDIVMNAS